jgi:hypothetical protein
MSMIAAFPALRASSTVLSSSFGSVTLIPIPSQICAYAEVAIVEFSLPVREPLDFSVPALSCRVVGYSE